MIITNGGSYTQASLPQSITQNSARTPTTDASRSEAAAALGAQSAQQSALIPPLVTPLRAPQETSDFEFAGRLRQQLIVPREPAKVETRTQTEVAREPARQAQVGYQNNNESVVGQFAARLNVTA